MKTKFPFISIVFTKVLSDIRCSIEADVPELIVALCPTEPTLK